jgi:3-methylcrotonyl-CoA carboxylase alpha subunit
MSEKIVTFGDVQLPMTIERDGALVRVTQGAGDDGSAGATHAIEIVAINTDEAELLIDGRRALVPFVLDGTRVSFAYEGEPYSFDVSERGARGRSRTAETSMSAPMPGVVLKILVAVGDVVTKATPLLILEAMKMEHQVVAPYDGTVRAIHCAQGDLVQPGVDLIAIDKADG